MDRGSLKRQLERMAGAVDLEAEVVLDEAIRGAPTAGAQAPRAVLLTGATGFLGAFLLCEILEQTSARVVCPVRGRDGVDCARRIRSTLETYRLWRDGFADRIETIPADLSKPLLGWTASAFEELAARIDAIYHCGAVVNLLFPYSLLRPANVRGTHEVLRLAARGAVPVHFVSTAGILLTADNARRTILETGRPSSRGLMHGYTQSKWVADRLVAAAAARGVQTAIYRPTIVGWHSRTGVVSDKDFVCGMIDACAVTGVAPEMDMALDVVPVDHVSRALVRLSLRPDSIGKTFHLANPRPTSWRQLVESFRSIGHSVRLEPYASWRAAVDSDRTNPYHRFVGMLPEIAPAGEPAAAGSIAEILSMDRYPVLDATNTAAGLSDSGIRCPELDGELLAVRLQHLASLPRRTEATASWLRRA